MAEKISLTKSAPSVSLAKTVALRGLMRVNLNWTQFPNGRPGFWKSLAGGGALDLDLACLVEMQDGDAGAVQALGNSFGAINYPPYIQLDQDDRTGQSAGGENLFINLDHFSEIKRILIFTFIYEGAPSWDQAKGVVTIFAPDGSNIEVKLDEYASGLPMCAIAMITNVNGQLVIERQVQYVDSHRSLDDKYGWGLNWVPGSK